MTGRIYCKGKPVPSVEITFDGCTDKYYSDDSGGLCFRPPRVYWYNEDCQAYIYKAGYLGLSIPIKEFYKEKEFILEMKKYR